jgi:hypothetical protein
MADAERVGKGVDKSGVDRIMTGIEDRLSFVGRQSVIACDDISSTVGDAFIIQRVQRGL